MVLATDQDASGSREGEDPVAHPVHADRITYPIRPGNVLGSSRSSMRMWLMRGTSGLLCLAFCHCDLDLDKWWKMDKWE